MFQSFSFIRLAILNTTTLERLLYSSLLFTPSTLLRKHVVQVLFVNGHEFGQKGFEMENFL
jgi:hypothetical protein